MSLYPTIEQPWTEEQFPADQFRCPICGTGDPEDCTCFDEEEPPE